MKWLVTGTLAVGLAIALIGVAAAQQDSHHPGRTAATTATTVDTIEQARQLATDYLARAGLADLAIGEVVPFANNYYVAVIDPTTGDGAFELLVNRVSGFVHPEPGPTMMWNTEYSPMFGAKGDLLQGAMESNMMGGMSSGMMGGGMMGNGNGMMDQNMMGDGDQGAMGYQAGAAQPLDQPLTTDAAVAKAQTFLTEQGSTAVATDPIAFPGYVTLKIERDGQIVGLLSVQTTTGAIWQHGWHGGGAS